MSQERTQECASMVPEEEMTEQTFLNELYSYMKTRDTPIERIPHLGFKQIDLFVMFKTVHGLGGYNQVTAHQLWKQVYNKLGGNPRSTSAATCTRRHYEKLILPYECYMRGEENKDLSLPRQQKRLRCHSFPRDEEEGLGGGKRSVAYGHLHTVHQNSHDFTEDRVRVIPMPMHLRHYFHPSSTALPPYLPVSPTMSTPQSHPDSRAFYLPPPLEAGERPQQHLAVLRTLANEYMSSSGWAEPLNLSCKEGAISTVSQQPSSFTPTSSNRTPKFLNKVVPLYRACGAAKDDGPEVSDSEVATAKPSPACPSICPLPALKRHVIDLTSSSADSPNSPPVTDPSIKTFNTSGLWHHGPAALDAVTTKIPETNLQSKNEGEAPKPSQSPLNLSCSSPSRDSSGRMEIQIPLALLQDWFKGNFVSGLHNRVSTAALQTDESQMKTGEASGRDKSSDLSFQEHQRHRDISVKEDDRNSTGSFTKERHTANGHHYTSIGRRHHPLSSGDTAGDWAPKTDCRGRFAMHHPDVLSKGVTGSSPYHLYPQRKDYVAQKLSPRGLMEAQDLVVGRNSSQVQSGLMQSQIGLHEQEQSTVPLSLTYRCETSQSATSPALLGPCEKVRSMSGPSNVFMANPTSSSLQPLTHEEYLKLRRLISSSL
ncbi:hypothetical protein SKAU_G00360050 [Synaphobranchus kaupii]|uniref:ARID domain-containing protein n=1 Tax=Synaphobranchus kaupii TaxID=118154 RepID=A0A9Q1EI35_SYNKA|nr:hypothetical protein SKAU_G00360050 [Synaphobranchus kaupii]